MEYTVFLAVPPGLRMVSAPRTPTQLIRKPAIVEPAVVFVEQLLQTSLDERLEEPATHNFNDNHKNSGLLLCAC